MTESATARRLRITPERLAELYESVLDLLREVGYHALTMDAVAARTRCSKATLYRQWGGKAELVAQAVRHDTPSSAQAGETDTGSLKGDLYALTLCRDDARIERNSALMRGLTMAIHTEPDLRDAFREYLIDPAKEDLRAALRRAVARGEIHADNPAVDFIMHMMIGAFVSRLSVEEEAPTQAFLVSYIDAVVLPALAARTPALPVVGTAVPGHPRG
ncbi:TetR/AcrR family transcriptional regulator [Streptomyces sp. NPDC046909]|uniref:TetR/AcrR family transcriptional regulator n=1 Tax=Streptomyces sp. NPDC046909 TaxID=3155617 RepID=UPI0033CCCD3D